MKLRLLTLFSVLLLSLQLFAQGTAADSAKAKGLDEKINEAFEPIATTIGGIVFAKIPLYSYDHTYTVPAPADSIAAGSPAVITKTEKKDIGIPFVLVVLIGGAVFCTLYFGFPNITKIGVAIRTVQGHYKTNEPAAEDNPRTIKDEHSEGEVSHFQALTAALSATVGLGNIAGVAVALSVGGPGATFWMVVAGFLGMASKFTECTLGVKYREVDMDGTVHGGPMYYLKRGFEARGMAGLGKVLAVFFALMCVGGSFGGGNMYQSNQAAQMFIETFDIHTDNAKFIFGLVAAGFAGLIIIGGIKRIAQVTDKLVPFMAILYVGTGLIILGMKASDIPTAFSLIFTEAFSPTAVAGGMLGAVIAGFQRAAFSNEAGVGSAAIAHSAVKTKYPASEGIVALLEPFIDTVIICTMSALVIIVTNIDGNFVSYGTALSGSGEGVAITSKAFQSVIPYSQYVLALVVVLFAFSTIISWSYYGLQSWKFLFGKSKAMDITYKVIFCFFTVVGASASLGAVIDFSDAMIFAMLFPNMIGIFFLAPVVKEEVAKYMAYIKGK